MIMRLYKTEDFSEIAALFYDTVHSVNSKDYAEEQLKVWATGTVDFDKWNSSLLEHYSVVAVMDNIIVGFGDIDKDNYLDRLYVHKKYQRQGIASAICDRLEQQASGTITVYASITARPFFEKRGYAVIKENQAERQKIFLTNYIMEK